MSMIEHILDEICELDENELSILKAKFGEHRLNNLTQKAKDNANKHGWYIYWNEKSKLNIPDAKMLDIGTTLCLIHSEVSEALEAYRNNDKENFNEEIADILIRCFHLCGDLNINIEEEIKNKMDYNKTRPKNHGRKNY